MAKKPEYKGPSDAVTALGQSQVDGWVGGIAGAAVGAVGGALVHDEAKHKNIVGALEKSVKKVNNKKVIKGVESVFEKEGVFKAIWHAATKPGKALIGALGGAIIIGVIGQMTGAFRGARKAKEARQQFDDITSENLELQHKLEAAEAQVAQSKSFVDTLKTERNKPASPEPVRG